MEFFTAYNRPAQNGVIHRNNPGLGTKPTYSVKLDATGHKIVYQSGETDLHALIQEDAESCKLQNIIRRATMGDTTALNARQAQYGDFTNMPKTMAEAQNMIIEAQQMFDKLPLDVRQSYNFSAEQFIADLGSEKSLKALGFKVENNIENVENNQTEN